MKITGVLKPVAYMMMKMTKPEITVIRCVNTVQQNAHCDAVISGLEKIGIPYAYNKGATLPVKTDKAIMWGWKWSNYWRERHKSVIVMEHGYIGDRFKYTSLAWNGLNGHGIHGVHKGDNGERFAEHGGIIHPWKHNPDAPVLLLGQLKNDQSLQGLDIEKVYNDWIRKSDRPVIFRPHPVAVKRGVHLNIKGAEVSQGTLYEALDNCSYALCYNSNSSVDAIMYGVPTVCMDKGSMVASLCGENIGHIIRPEREKTLHALAWKQYSLEEISQGWPLEKLWNMEL